MIRISRIELTNAQKKIKTAGNIFFGFPGKLNSPPMLTAVLIFNKTVLFYC
ncbi:hypothetical protein MuYL_0377 [Mucilaginibacter xinganensis]|uniref:Uncharacterized protein n=1 Tax=Mucilaginibacter xinganensis TaxID=1234841 RepID=A0A223NRA3_9SPHI|nr:hypothetical protein MuYL_0377 [Mucilaginibacter xinganensis]